MFNKALLQANNEAELNALALVIIVATNPKGGKPQPKDKEAAELKYLVALMAYEKKNAVGHSKPSFDNIMKLLYQNIDAAEPALKAVWSNDDADFRKSIFGSLTYRVIELCEYINRL